MRSFQSPFKRKDIFAQRAREAADDDALAGDDAARSDSDGKRSRGGERDRDVDTVVDGDDARANAMDALLDISLSGVSLDDANEATGTTRAGEARRVSETPNARVSVDPILDALDELSDAFDGTMTRSELAKRVSSANDVLRTVSEVRKMSERLRDLWSMDEDKSRELARNMSSRCWNFSIEKTSLETKAECGGQLNEEFVGPLLDMRYVSCELLDHASGLIDGNATSGISSLSTGIVNHLTLASLLHEAGEFKASEEQFIIAESYANTFSNMNGELDSDSMLMMFEAQTVRAKNTFLLGDMVGAQNFFRDAQRYAQSAHSKGNEVMCMTTLVNSKINLAETLNVSEKLLSSNRSEFDKRVRFLIDALETSYGDLFAIVQNSWSTSAVSDADAKYVLEMDPLKMSSTLLRTDGMFIRILHSLAKLYIHARSYEEALTVLEKLKTINSYVKECTGSDSVLVRDLHALTDSFLMDSMFIEAFAGIGEVSKACDVLEGLLQAKEADINVLYASCIKMARSEHGAGAVASNVGTLAKRMSSFSTKKRQEMITDIFETLFETSQSLDESSAMFIISQLECLLTDSGRFREIGFTRDGQSRAYAITWNAAAEMYNLNKYSIARKMFGMTLPLSTQSKRKNTSSSAVPVIRLQVMCDLENNDIERARESLQGLMEDKSSADVSTTLLCVKFQLISEDLEGLSSSICSLVKAGEPDALLYVAGELDDTRHHKIAADAFRSLYDMILDGTSTERMDKEEAFIFCSYLRHLKASVNGKYDRKVFKDASHLFEEFVKRVSKHNSLLADARQTQYLADFSWNVGLDAYESASTDAAYQFMFCSAFVVSKLHKIPEGLSDEQRSEYRYRQAVALLLSIASLTSHNAMSDQEDESERKKRELSNVARSKGAMAQLRGLLKNAEEDKYKAVRQISYVLEYEIACAQRDVASQSKLVDEISSMMATDPEYIGVLTMIADRGACMKASDLVTVSRAYEEAAVVMKAHSFSDSKRLGRLMRKRIQLSSRVYKGNDDAIHMLYDEAEEIFSSHPSYPPVEAQWLLSTCFNRAVRHERSMRTKEAVEWLKQTQKLLHALENILPDASEYYSPIVDDNLAVLTVELGAD